MTRRYLTICLLMLSAAGLGQASQPDREPVATLKITTTMVAISAVVKSRNGEPQGALTKDDFVLKQDGKEEPIRYFSQGSALPLTLALMVDTSASQRTLVGDEALASDVFFQAMLGREEDRAMLVQFDTTIVQLRAMTNSSNALRLALSSLRSQASTMNGTLLHDAIYSVAKGVLAKEPGRKAMVILTDGGDNGSRSTLAEAIEQAQRADVQIYSVYYTMRQDPVVAGPRAALPDTGMAELQKLSESTGGRVFTVSRTMGLRDIYAQIAQDLRLQYELGYRPPDDIQPNSYHKLELRTKDKKLTVQARKGFYARP